MKLRYFAIALLCSTAFAQNFAYNGQCSKGGQGVVTQGLLSSGTQPLLSGSPNLGSGVLASYPSCTVTVYLTGSVTLATLFSNKTGTPLANPFTANTDGSFIFWAVGGGYDVVMSGGGLPSTVTLTDINLGGTGGGGSSVTLQTNGSANTNQLLLNLASGAGVLVNNALGTTTFTNTGVLSITNDTAANTTGAFTSAATDYGIKGVAQPGGSTATLGFTCAITGICKFGNASNFITVNPLTVSNANSISLQDSFGNVIGFNNGSPYGNYIDLVTGVGSAQKAQLILSSNSNGQFEFDLNNTPYSIWTPTLATFNQLVNFAGTGAFEIGGSFGTAGQCLVSTGSAIGFGSCASSTVSSVLGTASQVVSSGGSNPVISLYGGPTGASAPLQLPGNLAQTQWANGDDSFKQTRKTDTSPTGTFLVGRAAGGPVLYQVDVLGNALFNSISTSNSATAGYFGFEQGPDAFTACQTAAAANVICEYAPTTVTAEYGRIFSGTGPSSVNGSVPVWPALSGSITQEAFMALSGSTAANVGCGTASLAAAANGNLLVGDGSGCIKNGGVNISTVLPSIQGPASPFTTASLTGVTVFTYTTSIQGATAVNIDCVGSYKFTGTVESAAFALNFTSVPTNMFLNVEIGVNATTGTHVYGRQTTNGALVTSSLAAAALGTYYPVWIHGAVLTNASGTFNVVAATSNAAGTVNIDANSFICSVK